MRPTRRQKEDLAMALRMLWRSTAALLAEHLGADAQTLPSDWNPIASLAGALLLPLAASLALNQMLCRNVTPEKVL